MKCTHHPCIFEEHALNVDVDMVNLVADGFVHVHHEDSKRDDGDVEEEAVQGGNGGLPPKEEEDDMIVEGDFEQGEHDEYDTDEMEVYGVHTNESSVGENKEKPIE